MILQSPEEGGAVRRFREALVFAHVGPEAFHGLGQLVLAGEPHVLDHLAVELEGQIVGGIRLAIHAIDPNRLFPTALSAGLDSDRRGGG